MRCQIKSHKFHSEFQVKLKFQTLNTVKLGARRSRIKQIPPKKIKNQTITATKTMRNVKQRKLRNQIQSHTFNSEIHLKEKLPDSHCKLRGRRSRRRQISQKNQKISQRNVKLQRKFTSEMEAFVCEA